MIFVVDLAFATPHGQLTQRAGQAGDPQETPMAWQVRGATRALCQAELDLGQRGIEVDAHAVGIADRCVSLTPRSVEWRDMRTRTEDRQLGV
jgi:hypothetical protein